MHFKPIGAYATREKAKAAAKKLAGKRTIFWGDGLSMRYTGTAGTFYLCEVPANMAHKIYWIVLARASYP